MAPLIYYDSKTGNVERFVNKIKVVTGWDIVRITDDLEIKKPGHLVTYTTQIGEVPERTVDFLKRHAKYIMTVSSSGNRNWGANFAKAAEKIAAAYHLPILLQFELSGTQPDVQKLIHLLNQDI
ncbi:class Ib ribonucleoside-diphosphate reductase assembly flavoprotein NrdI [Pedobacter sp. HMWF019]|uniref:class Ib ribonucleoside-diphosphate reductase assembly flavoprotein NrdI n=1 Tax=Pedobacter sp. HMWF019 TaxID=2056856 RepID=UPI000D39FE1F|nr:class Ib ribonucleoside-diphosphate reductase assembly flavoprotein NrdI [Pedobacter sp. HMWF019]PTT01513.1 class Ib ribonucleoside-diphosphate reductase assembly flavoprotein NrdI [Pedobacter sp. HMWF019]